MGYAARFEATNVARRTCAAPAQGQRSLSARRPVSESYESMSLLNPINSDAL